MRCLYSLFEMMVQATGVTFSAYVIIYIVETRFNPFSFNMLELMVSISISIVWIGIVAGLQNRRLGGWLSLSGVFFFVQAMYWVSGSWPSGWLFSVLTLPGLLYVVCDHFSRNLQR